MKNKSKILLSDLPKDIQWNTPEGFHEQLSQNIMRQTSNNVLESLKSSTQAFTTPLDYFNDLEHDIISYTSNLDLEPTFIQKWQEKHKALKDEVFFLTPERYFDLLPAKIQLAIFKQKSNWKSSFATLFMQYFWKPVPLIATGLCLLMTIMVFDKVANNPIKTTLASSNTTNTVQDIPSVEIVAYLAAEDNNQFEVVELASNSKINTADVFKSTDLKVDQKTIEETISSEDIEELTLEEL
jgi:hypothetical protein